MLKNLGKEILDALFSEIPDDERIIGPLMDTPALLWMFSRESIEAKAEERDKDAILLLGKRFTEGGGGFEKNLDEAEKHLMKASDLGHPEADLALGKLLLVLARNEEAYKFIRRAAELHEDAKAQWELGKLDDCYTTFEFVWLFLRTSYFTRQSFDWPSSSGWEYYETDLFFCFSIRGLRVKMEMVETWKDQ